MNAQFIILDVVLFFRNFNNNIHSISVFLC